MTSSSSSAQPPLARTPWAVAAGLGLAALCCLCVFGAIGIGVLQLNRAGSLAAVTATFTASPARPARTLTATSVPPTLTPFFAASATPSVELIQTATARAAWPLVISDTFSTRNPNDWSIGTQTGELATVRRLLTDGVYRWNVETRSDVFIRSGNSLPRVDDFYFAVDVKQLSGPSSTNYGVVFRERDDANMYYFSVQEVGRCTLIRLDDDESTPLLRAFCGEAIRPGEVNRLAISADGEHMLFYVNGQLIGEVEDARLAAGGLTLAVGVGEANQTAGIEFDNVELRAP
jgi:hypothetical protein